MKHFLQFFIVSVLCLLMIKPAQAVEPVYAHLFYGEGCPHCAKERVYFNSIKDKYPQLNLTEYEIYYHNENNLLLQKVGKSLQVQSNGVPFLVIGNQSIIGFSEGITPTEIEKLITECSQTACGDRVTLVQNTGKMTTNKQATESAATQSASSAINQKRNQPTESAKFIQIPFLGQKDVSTFSLPALTIVLAFLDGFNPCAMWTLLFLISLLLGLKDRKRMWILGVAFIASSALVYFLFLSAWLNLFLFLGFVVWIRAAIGIVALVAGYLYLKDYWKNKNGGCNVMGDKKRQKIFEKLRAITQKRQLVLALGGIIFLAVAVNMVELICSAGLPAIYTQVLSMSHLPSWQYYLYLLLYIFIFMLDDLIVFFTAMITMQAVGVQSKYARYSHLIGGFLMFIIGILLLFKPEWLMFG